MWTRGTQGMVVLALTCTAAWGQDVRTFVNTGNQHYQASDFSEALNRYEQALTENPQAYRARFNQGNVYYRLDDLEEALKAYREVAAETKDMALVARAKYNLGNTHFQQGLKQQDSDLQKALAAMRDSITQWRSALELNPENVNTARNIEVARLKIKDRLSLESEITRLIAVQASTKQVQPAAEAVSGGVCFLEHHDWRLKEGSRFRIRLRVPFFQAIFLHWQPSH